MVRALERANVRVATLERRLAAETKARQLAESECVRWKRRCYPGSGDVEKARITPEAAVAWLDTHAVRVQGGGWKLDASADESDSFTIWWEGDHYPSEIAAAIQWAADGLGLDQWAVLEQMSAIADLERGYMLTSINGTITAEKPPQLITRDAEVAPR